MQLRTVEQLLVEYREIVLLNAPIAMKRTRGMQKLQELTPEGSSGNSGIAWALRAQIGTLDKLAVLLPSDRTPSSIELLAAARNLFENLVWLKLFALDAVWGTFFYGQFLKNQREDLAGMIAKFEAEATLFDTIDQEDSAIVGEVFTGMGDEDQVDATDIAERGNELERRKNELDHRTRRAFALFGAAATFNGYGFQAHLIRTKEIPRFQDQLAIIDQRIEDFTLEVGEPAKAERYLGRWNWRGEAQRVGMAAQYDFLYRLTSRLLHATPMNIITEKELLEGEQLTLLEYIIVTAHDIFEAIETFSFPGKVEAIYVHLSDEAGEPGTRG